MLADIAALRHTSIVFPGAGVFVIGVLVIIVLILVLGSGRRGR